MLLMLQKQKKLLMELKLMEEQSELTLQLKNKKITSFG
jgi:hypothetical protein